MGTSMKHAAFAVAIVIALMIAAATAVQLLYPGDWQPVEATVRGTRIESTRPGTVQWSLIVDSTYDVSGHVYEAATDVFHNSDRTFTEAEQTKWPVGRTFTLFVDADDPQSTSLVADGGRQAATVVAVILTPLLLMIAGFVAYVVARVRANRDTATRRAPRDAGSRRSP